MRKEEAVKRSLGRLRLPDRVETIYVPCPFGPRGRHAVSIGYEAVTHVLVHIEAECWAGLHAEAARRLGGETCLVLRDALRDHLKGRIIEGEHEKPDAFETLDIYRIRLAMEDRRAREHKRYADPVAVIPSKGIGSNVRWNLLLTKRASQAAGFGVSVRLDAEVERVMSLGPITTSKRKDGRWAFDEQEMLNDIRYARANLTVRDGYCLACQKGIQNEDAHARREKHALNVVEGLRRAMRALPGRRSET